MGVHEFTLIAFGPSVGSSEERIAELAGDPPEGCVFDPKPWGYDCPGLHCRREGESRLAAVAEVVGEVVRATGIRMTDLGVDKLYEWCGDPDESNTWGRDIAAQLLLMGLDRVQRLGYSPADAVRFVHTAAGRPHLELGPAARVEGPTRSDPPH